LFRYFRVKKEIEAFRYLPGALSGEFLAGDATSPISIHQINSLPENTKTRIYRGLIPPALLQKYQIDPVSWESKAGNWEVRIKADTDSNVVKITIGDPEDIQDEILSIEIQDNAFNGIDLNLIVLGDPDGSCYQIYKDETGNPTLFGTLRRNLKEEQTAMEAGLAPGQTRMGMGGSRVMLDQLEAFLAALGQRAYFLEPLTYVSAWIFERRGFAYVRGHKLMEEIQREFQPGGALNQALDGSSPFRDPTFWQTVRGRAWAIHDGILESINNRWDNLRMVKQIGRHSGVETFPEANY
jgi:hypothetical protein